MLFMVIERFKDANPKPIYQHFREHGRGLPEGLKIVGIWVEPNFDRCFQVMECDDARLLQQWVLHWREFATFEIVPVVPSAETRELVEKLLPPGGV